MKRMTPSNSSYYYYQDASGSTTHLADSSGNLVEWYRYDLQGTPFVYSSSGTLRSVSAYGIRHLFTGQQWYAHVTLYDLRNRFYSPDTGRFLQGDPSGFNGDATNLYRYCGNNPLKRSDPMGLQYIQWSNGPGPIDANRVTVTGDNIIEPGHDWTSGLREFNDPSFTLGNRDFSPSLREFGDRPDITGGKELPPPPNGSPTAMPNFSPNLPSLSSLGPTPPPTPPPLPTPAPAFSQFGNQIWGGIYNCTNFQGTAFYNCTLFYATSGNPPEAFSYQVSTAFSPASPESFTLGTTNVGVQVNEYYNQLDQQTIK